MRTTKVERGTPGFPFAVASVWHCTWFSYYTALEEGKTPPCYWDRPTKTGSYTDAKFWLENFREPWEVHKEKDYQPTSGDRVIFDGNYGHVINVINNDNGDCLCAEYRNGDENSFKLFHWIAGSRLSGCGNVLGYLHWPYEDVKPVERNNSVDQIKCEDSAVRIRTAPDTTDNNNIIGHISFLDGKNFGYYNVLSTIEVQGYTWYEIEKGKYCANIGTTFLSAEDDIVKQIEGFVKNIKESALEKDKIISEYEEKINKIHELSKLKGE